MDGLHLSENQNGGVEKKENPLANIKIDRPLYEHKELRENYNYEEKARKKCEVGLGFIKGVLPIIDWLPQYNWKAEFTPDVIAGVTVAIMHISQGMAYGLLAQVPPVVGIYTAFFPVIVYIFFGMAKHNSMGTFAVTCLMVGVVINDNCDDTDNDCKIRVGSSVCLVTGVFQLIMYIFRLGIVSTLLSETLVSGFTTGAAVHVLVSQIKDVLGVKPDKEESIFGNIYTLISIAEHISDFNYMAFIISVLTMIVSIANNEYLKPKLAKKCPIPFPLELVLVLVGTGCSYGFDLAKEYKITVVGEIPSGLPPPSVPPIEDLISGIWVQCIMIAVVSYAISLSMGLIFAQKYNYEVDANQELLAQGLGNLVGSFFSCITFAASLSRSSIQANAGCKSNITSAVSCSILFIILMWVGPYFEQLPKAILAGIIVVALKGLLFQMKDLPKFWYLNKLDGIVWVGTFLAVTFVSIDIGLGVGIVMSLAVILIRGIKPYACLLGNVPGTELYLDIKRYKGAEEIPEIKIFHYQGSINFASKAMFRAALYEKTGVNPAEELKIKRKLEKLVADSAQYGSTTDLMHRKKNKSKPTEVKCIIYDFTALSYIDPSGIIMMKTLSLEYKKLNIPIYIAGCSEPVYETMVKCDLLDEKKEFYKIFVTLHDAVQFATKKNTQNDQDSMTIATIF
ncbi:prestin-like [Atheta coriaria]|uniref:prestin-like n=1 Tax=Dalotia coriaria TaxID=877792 RepID=UPI0031F3EB10